MKSLITRIASIGIFSLVLAGSSATTQAQALDPTSVHVHKGAVALYVPSVNAVLIKVTVVCTGGTGTVMVTVTQTAAQSNANTATSGSGSSSVKCDGHRRSVAVSVGAFDANLGDATATAMLTPPMGPSVTDTQTIVIGFPVVSTEEEEGD